MELGTLQKEWIKSLREHPERQGKRILGRRLDNDDYQACCLGELKMVDCRLNNFPLPFDEFGNIVDEKYSGILGASYQRYGLNSSTGIINGGFHFSTGFKPSLAEANDSGVSWKEIADFIEQNPEKVFTHSV